MKMFVLGITLMLPVMCSAQVQKPSKRLLREHDDWMKKKAHIQAKEDYLEGAAARFNREMQSECVDMLGGCHFDESLRVLVPNSPPQQLHPGMSTLPPTSPPAPPVKGPEEPKK
jgi:hypothetical protein